VQEVGIAVGRTEAAEDTDAASRLGLVQVLVEVVVHAPRAVPFPQRLLPDRGGQALVDGGELIVRVAAADELVPGETEESRPHAPLTGEAQLVDAEVVEPGLLRR